MKRLSDRDLLRLRLAQMPPHSMDRRRAINQLSGWIGGGVGLGLLPSCMNGMQSSTKGQGSEILDKKEGQTLLAEGTGKPKFLIVITCSGGASILDSFMALRAADVTTAGGNPDGINSFLDAQVVATPDSTLRAVDQDVSLGALGGLKVAARQSEFVKKHFKDIMVVTTEGTSVNHGVAQKRSLTGNDAWRGRTIQEAVAAQYGQGMPIPNLNMGLGGFGVAGIDSSLPAFAQQMSVVDPLFWPLSLSGRELVEGGMPEKVLEVAREVRSSKLERRSLFMEMFGKSKEVTRWLEFRDSNLNDFEKKGLLKRLLFTEGAGENDPEIVSLRQAFPKYKEDPFDAQAILAYLAITRGIAVTVTMGPSFAAVGESLASIYNPPLGFDFSHQDHRGTQALMWNRVLTVTSKLITLLTQKEFEKGESFWSRSAIYFASDFGRDKNRPSGSTSWGTGHHLNNAAVVVSPMAKGNSILGGVDAKTGLTYGFDVATGTPEVGRKTSEKELFSGLVQMMGVDTAGAGLPDVKAMRKA